MTLDRSTEKDFGDRLKEMRSSRLKARNLQDPGSLLCTSPPRGATRGRQGSGCGGAEGTRGGAGEASAHPPGSVKAEPSAQQTRPPMLDTPPPESNQLTRQDRMTRALLLPSARRFYNRMRLGLILPGRYFFVTWTTATTSEDVERYWPALRQWLHRYRPGATWAYCLTREGKAHGVIHMVIRLQPGQARLEVRDLRAQWQALTGARQLKIRSVRPMHKQGLARYLAEQGRKKRVAGEMAYQPMLKRWRWSQGWLPKGFTKAFGRFFWRTRDLDPSIREQLVREWLLRASKDASQVDTPPRVPVVVTVSLDEAAKAA